MKKEGSTQTWRPPTKKEDLKDISECRRKIQKTRWYNFFKRRKLKYEIRCCIFRLNLNNKK